MSGDMVDIKRMFGGVGLFRDGLMFGKIGSDVFRLKVDEHNKAEYEARGMKPFVHPTKKKGMPYWEVPADVVEDRAVLIDDEAVSTEGMQAFDLPDIVVPCGEDDAEPAQAAAFALAARMVIDRFRPVEGGVFRASESAPLYGVGRIASTTGDDPCPFENPNGAWRLDRKG